MVRANPLCAFCAIFVACALVSSAFVATTPIVVLVATAGPPNPFSRIHSAASNGTPASSRGPAITSRVWASRTEPMALTTTRAPTTTPWAFRTGTPDPGLHGARDAQNFSDRRAAAGTDVAFSYARTRSLRRRAVPHRAVRSAAAASDSQIEDDGRRDERDDVLAHAITDLLLLKVAHHAAGRVKSVRAAARQADPVNALDRFHGIEKIEITRPRRTPARRRRRRRRRVRTEWPCTPSERAGRGHVRR